MPPLLADENFPLPVVRLLRIAGLDVVTAYEAGLIRTPDRDVLAAATAAGRAVLTLDKDYVRLHNRGAPHAGIVHVSEDNDVVALSTRILAALVAVPVLGDQLIRVRLPNPPPS
jgi:predicted nuclease of predicted toxin-antitoxin system